MIPLCKSKIPILGHHEYRNSISNFRYSFFFSGSENVFWIARITDFLSHLLFVSLVFNRIHASFALLCAFFAHWISTIVPEMDAKSFLCTQKRQRRGREWSKLNENRWIWMRIILWPRASHEREGKSVGWSCVVLCSVVAANINLRRATLMEVANNEFNFPNGNDGKV